MVNSRRSFIANATWLMAGASLSPKQIFVSEKKKTLTGIQLYSVREDMFKNPEVTLKALAQMGYQYVEHANYVNRKFYGYTAREFKNLLDGYGLKMPSGHTVMGKQHWDLSKKDFTDAWKQTIEDAAICGQDLVISPWFDESMRKTYDDMLAYMEVFNKCGELCIQSGMRFGYHNHDFEFTEKLNGINVYDIILDNTDPKLVTQQLDIGNLYHTGANAYEIVKKHPGRFVSLHVKDEIKSVKNGVPTENYESTILGKGVANAKLITDLAKKSGGTLHFIVEQESYQGMNPMICAEQNLKIMQEWGY